MVFVSSLSVGPAPKPVLVKDRLLKRWFTLSIRRGTEVWQWMDDDICFDWEEETTFDLSHALFELNGCERAMETSDLGYIFHEIRCDSGDHPKDVLVKVQQERALLLKVQEEALETLEDHAFQQEVEEKAATLTWTEMEAFPVPLPTVEESRKACSPGLKAYLLGASLRDYVDWRRAIAGVGKRKLEALEEEDTRKLAKKARNV